MEARPWPALPSLAIRQPFFAFLGVMPSCFFILLRHHLSIEGVLVQQREVRLFHKFGEAHLLRTLRHASAPSLPSGPRSRRWSATFR